MKKLSRRTLLRGAGTAIALPFLDAMLPAFANTTPEAPTRMMYVYAPTGMMPQTWTPATAGSDFEFQRVMKPLEKFRKDILVMTGLGAHDLGVSLNDGPGDHARAVASYLTGVRPRKTLGADLHAGTSADQVAARVLGQKTQVSVARGVLRRQPIRRRVRLLLVRVPDCLLQVAYRAAATRDESAPAFRAHVWQSWRFTQILRNGGIRSLSAKASWISRWGRHRA